LTVEVNHFSPGNGSVKDWELVFPQFAEQIKKNVLDPELHSVVANKFSTTTVTDQACHEIALMSSMKNYFSYRMMTLCGIPEITLFGSVADWEDLHLRTKKLGDFMLPEFTQKWLSFLLPVLEEIVLTVKGNVNVDFWKRFVKYNPSRGGSGAHPTISGWINLFYPFLDSGRANTTLQDWKELNLDKGPDPKDFPTLILSTPVVWNYLGKKFHFHFHAGIVGGVQDKNTKMVFPNSAWIITRDPEGYKL